MQIKIAQHGTYEPILSENNRDGLDDSFKLEIEPPTKVFEKTFLIKVRVSLWKTIDFDRLTVTSFCHFHVIDVNENLILDAKNENTIRLVTQLCQTTIDQTRVYFQGFGLLSEKSKFKNTIINHYKLPQDILPIVKACMWVGDQN